MHRFFNLFINKSFRFKSIGFIAIVFSIFFFNPLDSFAYTYVPEDIKITFYGSGGSTDYCEGLKQCYNFVPDKIASRVQIQSQKVSFSEGKQYKMYISLKLSVPTDYTIYDYYLSDYLVRNYNINVNKSDFKFLYWDDFGWFNVYQWDLEITVNPTFQGSGVSFDFYKSQDTNQQIWILDVLDFHSELLSDSSDTSIIIDNQNKNTQDIIDNQNKNTQDEIESQKVCEKFIIDKTYIVDDNQYLLEDGTTTNNVNYGITNYIEIDDYVKTLNALEGNASFCFYTDNKTKIQCFKNQTLISGTMLNVPTNAKYFRASIYKVNNVPKFEIKLCKNGNQALDDSINDLNNSLNNDNIEGSEGVANSFFDNFTDNDNGGISGIVTAPLVAINAMLNGTCTPLSTTFKGKEISLQCGTELWGRLTGLKEFLNVVLGGYICYRICIKLFKLIQNMKNPDNDRVEVMDL